MSIIEQGGTEDPISPHSGLEHTRLSWWHIAAISIFYLALNFHWVALGVIVLPSQVAYIAGDAHKGTALATVVIPGAFVALIANPLFGFLSDRTRGKLAYWGKRRPYIFIGTLGNVIVLIWMAVAPSIFILAIAYSLVQFFSNAAQASFHALLPDVVSQEQRGTASGVMGLMTVIGGILGTVVAGLFIDASKPAAQYHQGLQITYGLMILVMIIFMLITIFSVHENQTSIQTDKPELADPVAGVQRTSWLTRSLLITIAGTIIAMMVLWGVLTFWNNLARGSQISQDWQQVLLEMVATIGILRIFEFNPRRNPDFAWVLVTRLVMMMGIYTLQNFLQYYMQDVIRVQHPEQETTKFIIVTALFSLISTFAVGRLSDRYGRKRMIYLAGSLMALVGVVFIFTQSLLLVLIAGGIFGLGYGAYQSVDWALVADVLPSREHFARDMGIWNISLSISQILAPVLGGPLIDYFKQHGHPVLGYKLLFIMAIIYCIIGTVTVRFIKKAH